MQEHWGAWFPQLPSYQAFNHRLNLLNEVWPVLLGELWGELELPGVANGVDQLLDSLPIMLAVRNRSYHAKVACDLADQTFCESKKFWYHGVKLHLLGAKQYRQMPVPLSLCLTEASRHDLPVLKEQLFIRGACWLQVADDREALWLEEGDLAIVPHGSGHRIFDAPDTPCRPLAEILAEQPVSEEGLLRYGGTGAATALV
ncbi:MAG: cupin domain-containing protein [Acidobacteriota bacterium]|nr:cupin domain-containing protein [Acidobacteriota bacterium]